MRYGKNIISVFIFILSLSQSVAQNNRNGYPQTLHLPPEADFGWSDLCFGDTTHFINQTIRGNYFRWAILNSDTDTVYRSTNVNISYLFDTVGTYSVFLEANNGHIVSVIKTINIINAANPQADFTFMHCSNHFVNMTRCATSYQWDLGDGTISTDPFPIHEYADTGTYAVKLTVSNGTSSFTKVKNIYVDCQHFPNPTFTWRLSYDTLFVHLVDPVTVYFNSWLFSDTLVAHNVRDTFMIYPDTGLYDVVFISISSCLNTGSDQWVHVVFPKLDFTSSPVKIVPSPVSINSELDVFFNATKKEMITLETYNALGQKISENKYTVDVGLSELKINTNGFREGAYYLVIQSATVNTSTKFLVLNN